MGYTHYFQQLRDCPADAWDQILNAFPAVALKSGVHLVYEYDDADTPPEVGPDVLRFNGSDKEGHESFWLSEKREPLDEHFAGRADMHGFSFCKTACKPYDVVVVAMLILASHYAPGVWRIGSDGDARDWNDGLALARKIEPKARLPSLRSE